MKKNTTPSKTLGDLLKEIGPVESLTPASPLSAWLPHVVAMLIDGEHRRAEEALLQLPVSTALSYAHAVRIAHEHSPKILKVHAQRACDLAGLDPAATGAILEALGVSS